MGIHSAVDVFSHELQAMYDAEHLFLEAQEEMLGKASNPRLKLAIEKHIDQTKGQIDRLEKVFHGVGETATRGESKVARAAVEEARSLMEKAENDEVRDLLIGASILKVEHFEIAAYEALVRGADIEDLRTVASLLQDNLNEEKQTATIAKNTAPELLQNAAKARSGQGIVQKTKEKLTG